MTNVNYFKGYDWFLRFLHRKKIVMKAGIFNFESILFVFVFDVVLPNKLWKHRFFRLRKRAPDTHRNINVCFCKRINLLSGLG